MPTVTPLFKALYMGATPLPDFVFAATQWAIFAPVFANKSTEAGERVYKVYNNGHEVQSVALPNFLEYRNVKYPEDPNTSVSSPYTTLVFDVENVVSVQQARVQYPNIYVRGTVKKKIDRELTESVKSSDVFLYKNNLQAYNDWLKETKYPIGRRASAMINELLK